jgi:hypothetical protein
MSQPSVARMYDFSLGGSHHTAADRAAGEQILAAIYRRTNSRGATPRTLEQLTALAGDYQPVEPGPTRVTHWRPGADPGPADPIGMPMMAGVFRRDSSPEW